jgi:hypothetical protein
MITDTLYLKIRDDLKPGQAPVTLQDARRRWGYVESYAQEVMNWMADQQPPTMMRLPNTSPLQWQRI